MDSIGRGTGKRTVDVVCDVVRSYNCVARINVGAELASGIVH